LEAEHLFYGFRSQQTAAGVSDLDSISSLDAFLYLFALGITHYGCVALRLLNSDYFAVSVPDCDLLGERRKPTGDQKSQREDCE
jgi:hypothetical protein